MAGGKGFQSAEMRVCVEKYGSLLLLSRGIHPNLLCSEAYPATEASDDSPPSGAATVRPGRPMVHISSPLWFPEGHP